MNKFWNWFCFKPIVIDKWGYRFFNKIPKEKQEYVQSLIERGENVFIYSDGRYLHLYVMDLKPSPGFSGATLTSTNE